LGLVRIGQLESLPREEFLSRFGSVLLRRLDQAFGRLDEPVPACPLPPRFEVGWSAEHPTARRETIAAAVEWLIARLAAMLARCGRGALRLDCRLFLEQCIRHTPCAVERIKETSQTNTKRHTACAGYSLSVGLFQPTADAKRLFDLLQLQLERLRIGSAVTAIEAAASLSAPLEPRKQATLFDLDGAGKGDRHLLCKAGHQPQAGRGPFRQKVPVPFSRLVERLCSRLGSRAVVGVRLRPEAQPELSWHCDPLVGRRRRNSSRLSTTSQRRPCDLPPRPLRLLPRPLPTAVTAIAPAGPPLRFQFDGCQHEVACSWGPERIETGWWRGRAVGRDYFCVETAAAARFWLFRRLRDGKWFLHGLFE
jgi:protein ImuB